MIEAAIGIGAFLVWAAAGNIMWVLVAHQKFDPACWLAWPLMLMAIWRLDA